MTSQKWQLFWHFRQLSLMKMMEYRTDFFFWMIVSAFWTIFNFWFFDLIFQVTGDIAGWSRMELYVVLAVFTMIDAFTWGFFAQNMWSYTHHIFSGELSGYLIKPVDTQFIYQIKENSLNNVPRFFMGLGILIWALIQLNVTPTPLEIIFATIAFIASLIFVYNLWFMVATLAFWVDKLENINEIVPALRRIWMVPRHVYSGAARLFLTLVLPFGLISSVPSELLLHRDAWIWCAYLCMTALASWGLSRWFFRLSLRKYTSVGG